MSARRLAYSLTFFAAFCLIACGDDIEGPTGGFSLPSQIIAADRPVPPMQGGTLESSDKWIVVGESARGQVSIVDSQTLNIDATIKFSPTSMPGRLAVFDNAVFVALRNEGKVVRLVKAEGDWKIDWSSPLCARLEGLAVESSGQVGWGTCLGGDLVKFDAQTGAVLSRVWLEVDLRDVVVDEDVLYISIFRAATVLILDRETLVIKERFTPQARDGSIPTVGWRLRRHPRGGALFVYQLSSPGSTDRPIEVRDTSTNAYGDVGRCRVSLMATAMVHVRPDREQRGGRPLGDIVLALDVVASNDLLEPELSIAASGNRNGPEPGPPGIIEEREVHFFSATSGLTAPICPTGGISYNDNRHIVSVDYLDDGRLAYQSINPAELIVGPKTIPLQGEDLRDTGHFLFHSDAGGGIACASCHPFGRDDGITWHFVGDVFTGPRRTPLIAGGIEHTAPFHWSGDVMDYTDLMHQIFSRRMGGVDLGERYAAALGDYVEDLPVPDMMVPGGRDEEAIERGRALFSDPVVACAGCHVPEQNYTINAPQDVGTGEAFQVPRLVGLRVRAPYMHDGCAKTLEERFEPECGGTAHGSVSHLSDAELADLVAFMETL